MLIFLTEVPDMFRITFLCMIIISNICVASEWLKKFGFYPESISEVTVPEQSAQAAQEQQQFKLRQKNLQLQTSLATAEQATTTTSGAIPPSILRLKIDLGNSEKPWIKYIDTNTTDKNLFSPFEEGIFTNEYPIYYSHTIDYSSPIALDRLLDVFKYFTYEKGALLKKPSLVDIKTLGDVKEEIKKRYSGLPADKIQQSLIWTEKLSVQPALETLLKDLFVDLYADALCKVDFTKMKADRLKWYLPLTVDIDKMTAKKLMEWFLQKSFPIDKRFDLNFKYRFWNLNVPYPSNVHLLLYKHTPALFMELGQRSELQYTYAIRLTGRDVWNPEFGPIVLNVLIMNEQHKVMTIDKTGTLKLYVARSNDLLPLAGSTAIEELAEYNLVSSATSTATIAPAENPIATASLIKLSNERVGVGYGNSFYLIEIGVNNVFSIISQLAVSGDQMAQITHLEECDDLVAVTYKIASEYFYHYYKVDGNKFISVEKQPENAIEITSNVKYNPADSETKRIVQKRMVLVPREQYKGPHNEMYDQFLSLSDVVKMRGFTVMPDCYDFILDTQQKKMYSAMSKDFVCQGVANDFEFLLREYDLIPKEIQNFCAQLNVEAQSIDQQASKNKSSYSQFNPRNSLTLNILYYIHQEYPSIAPKLKIQKNLERGLSKRIKKTMPIGIQNRIYAYVRKKYFEIGGSTRKYVIEPLVQNAISLAVIAGALGIANKLGWLPETPTPDGNIVRWELGYP